MVLILLLIGAVGLFKGAGLIVSNASCLAAKLGVSTLVIGSSVVAFGTVLPELTVAVTSSLAGLSDIVVGNALGTTVFNIGIVLGLAAIINPISIQKSVLRHEFPWFLLYAVVIYALSYDLALSRQDGVILLALSVVFVWYSVKFSHREVLSALGAKHSKTLPRSCSWPKLFLGLALVVLGAKLFVDSAVVLAGKLGVSELLIGILVIAIGTSLPELFTTLMASRHRQAEIGVGNVIGSNTLNVFFILGAAAVIRPITIHPDLYIFDFPMVIFFAILVSLLFKTHHRLSRLEGVFLVIGYIFYFIYSLKFWG